MTYCNVPHRQWQVEVTKRVENSGYTGLPLPPRVASSMTGVTALEAYPDNVHITLLPGVPRQGWPSTQRQHEYLANYERSAAFPKQVDKEL
jgi:hypothetical protein